MPYPQIVAALLTRLSANDHIIALCYEIRLRAEAEAIARCEADENASTADYDALAGQLESLIMWAQDRPRPE